MFNPEGLQSSAGWAQHIPHPTGQKQTLLSYDLLSLDTRRYRYPARTHFMIRYSELQTGISYRHHAVNLNLQASTVLARTIEAGTRPTSGGKRMFCAYIVAPLSED